jgi:hypothetical protein
LPAVIAFTASATHASAASEQPRRGDGPVELVSPQDLTLVTVGRFEFSVTVRRGYRVRGVVDGRSFRSSRRGAGAFAREVSVRRLGPGEHVIAAMATPAASPTPSISPGSGLPMALETS